MAQVIPMKPSYQAQTARENNDVGKIIRSGRKRLGYTLMELSELLKSYQVDVQYSAITKWENGETIPNAYQLIAVCHALGMQGVTGQFEGTMSSPLNAEGMKLLDEFRAYLVSTGRYAVTRNAPPKTRAMKVYSLPASAGTGDWLDSSDFETLEFSEKSIPDGAEFGVYVDGHSMEPAYHDGQIAWIKPCSVLAEGDVAVFIYDGMVYIKEYHEELPEQPEDFTDSYGVVHPNVIFRSLNRKYPDVPIHDGSYYLFGKVLN